MHYCLHILNPDNNNDISPHPSQNIADNNILSNNDTTAQEIDNRKYYLQIPYITDFFNKLSHRLKAFNIFIIPKMFYSLSSIIKIGKDKIPTLEQNNLVYKLSCNDCDATYIGETKRSLGTRVTEHKRDSKKPTKNTPIFRHIFENNHSFNFDEPKILDFEQNYFKRIASEFVHIGFQAKSINIKEDINKLNSIYTPFFQKIKN